MVEVCLCVCWGRHIGQWALGHLSSQDKSRGVLLSVAAGSGRLESGTRVPLKRLGCHWATPAPASLRAVQGSLLLPRRCLLVLSSFLFASDVVKHQVLTSTPAGSFSGTLLSSGILTTMLRYTPEVLMRASPPICVRQGERRRSTCPVDRKGGETCAPWGAPLPSPSRLSALLRCPIHQPIDALSLCTAG